ncbi:MAG: hypothetical protein U0169_10210 [Polyangiaceae bacterium]
MRHTLLALQMFFPLPAAEPLRLALQSLVARAPDGASFEAKAAFYRAVVDAIVPWVTVATRGVWDYVEDPGRADDEYRGWCEGTVRDAMEPKPADAGGRYRQGQGHTFVTLLFLVKQGSNTDTTICERCRMPEDTYFTRAAFHHILTGIPLLNFATVRGDAIYVRPGEPEQGVLESELAEPHYEYLRALR